MTEEHIPKKIPSDLNPRSGWLEGIFVLVAFSFTFYLAALSYEGFFARYLGDDFCYANTALHQGVIQGFNYIFISWSGRFSTILITQFGTLLGSSLPAILPVTFIFFLAASLFWFFNHGLQIRAHAMSRIKAAYLALIAAFFFFFINPVRYQVLDWMNGSITYTLPLIFLTLLITWFLRTVRYDDVPQNFMTFFGIFLVALIGAGFSETNTALQVTVIILAILFSIIHVRKGKKWKVVRWQLIGLAGSLIGMLIMILAPGNKVRQALLPTPPGLSTIFTLSFQYSWDFLVNVIRTMPLPTVVLFLTSLVLGSLIIWNQNENSEISIPKPKIWSLILLPVIVFILIASICAPSIYAESAYPESRALSAGLFVFVVGVVFLGFQIGNLLSLLKSRLGLKAGRIVELVSLLFLLVLSAYPVRATINLFPEIQSAQKFTSRWDQRDAAIHQAVSEKILVLDLPAINSQHGIQEVTEDPNNWVNKCVANYYGLNSIVAH